VSEPRDTAIRQGGEERPAASAATAQTALAASAAEAMDDTEANPAQRPRRRRPVVVRPNFRREI
jgi:hypothetical protein